MTKEELIKALLANQLPDDTEILINVRKYHDFEATWDEIGNVDRTKDGVPILIGLGKTVYGLKKVANHVR